MDKNIKNVGFYKTRDRCIGVPSEDV